MKPHVWLAFALIWALASASVTCGTCRSFFSAAISLLNSTAGIVSLHATSLAYKIFESIGVPACVVFRAQDYCANFFPQIFALYFPHLLTFLSPELVCYSINLCSRPAVVPDQNSLFARRILRDTPPSRASLPPPTNNSAARLRLIVLNDVHVDFEYRIGGNADCKSSTCCREPAAEGNVPAEKWGHLGDCDLPPITLESFLSKMNDWENATAPEVILWLGDTPDHMLWGHTRKSHLEGVKKITTALKRRYNGVGTVYPVLGNHEGLPCNHMNFATQEQQWILDACADIWRDWLTDEG